MRELWDLRRRKALVTGAGRGIGKGIALALAEAGADVGVTALGQANANHVAEQITALGRSGRGWAADGTRVEPMQRLAEQVVAELGGLDILVNAIGDHVLGAVAEGGPSAAPSMAEDDWHRIIDLNLTSDAASYLTGQRIAIDGGRTL